MLYHNLHALLLPFLDYIPGHSKWVIIVNESSSTDIPCLGSMEKWTLGTLSVGTSGGQSTQIKYLSKSTDTYNKILLQ